MVLLNLRCTRCLVNPAVVEKLGMRFRLLKVSLVFCQLDGSIEREIPVTFITKPIEMQMGVHTETLSFLLWL